MKFRPILISTVQYDAELQARSLSQVDVLQTAKRLGADGAELRLDYWQDKARELPAARRALDDLGIIATYATSLMLFTSDSGQLREAVDAAAALGSPLLRVFSGLAPDDNDRVSWDTAREIVRYATSRGIVV